MFHRLRQLIGDKNELKLLKGLLNVLFQIHKHLYRNKNYNHPKGQFILAIWHAHQCGLYSVQNIENLNVMTSKSRDGDIVTFAAEGLGFKTVRGSHQRGGATAALEMITALKRGENGCITIDGPRGPKHIVKKGIIEIARLSGVPIVPMMWYGGKYGFIKFKTWDEFCYPVPLKMTVNLYGEPIYVPNDITPEQAEFYRKRVEDELNKLSETIVKDYKKLK